MAARKLKRTESQGNMTSGLYSSGVVVSGNEGSGMSENVDLGSRGSKADIEQGTGGGAGSRVSTKAKKKKKPKKENPHLKAKE